MSKIQFQQCWKIEYPWVKEGRIPGSATCVLCSKQNIYYASMGKSALTSHAKSKKHQLNFKNSRLTLPIKGFLSNKCDDSGSSSYLLPPTTGPSALVPQSSVISTSAATSSSSSFSFPSTLPDSELPIVDNSRQWWKAKDDVTMCETLWCIQTVMCHSSLRTAESSVRLFKRMFHDSSIAGDIKLGKDKISYTIVYGLAQYFKSQLTKLINLSDTIVVSFDESMNKVSQKQQMDIVVRFWDTTTNKVSNRYYSSQFLHKTAATDLVDSLKEGLKDLDERKIVQLSMDGPNVNIKLYNIMKKELSVDGGKQLLNIGSCSLHVVNGAFKTGFNKSGWSLLSFFRALFYLFKNSPSRRGIYIGATNSRQFPLKFCAVRWLENIPVAKRALDVIDDVQKFVDFVTSNKMRAIEKSSSFITVANALSDQLLKPKLAFFLSVAEDFEPFLTEFQTDAPMIPFLHSSLINLLKVNMSRVVKDDVLAAQPIQSIELQKQNLKSAKEIDLGYGTRAVLRQLNKCTDLEIMQFRQECKVCLIAIIEKLLEKCPLKYPLTEATTFLNPQKIVCNSDQAIRHMTKTMDIMVSSNIIPASTAQNGDRQYRELMEKEDFKCTMRQFNKSETRLDSFWMDTLKNHNPELEKVVKIVLSLSHGNASVERGFSINKDILVENLHEESIVAQRIIYNTVQEVGGIEKINIGKDLLLSIRNSNARWKEALNRKREQRSAEDKIRDCKRKAALETKALEEKKRKLMLESQKALAEIDEQIKGLKKQ